MEFHETLVSWPCVLSMIYYEGSTGNLNQDWTRTPGAPSIGELHTIHEISGQNSLASFPSDHHCHLAAFFFRFMMEAERNSCEPKQKKVAINAPLAPTNQLLLFTYACSVDCGGSIYRWPSNMCIADRVCFLIFDLVE